MPRISAFSFNTQEEGRRWKIGRLSGPPAREVLTALSFLAAIDCVTKKGSSSSEATRAFFDKGAYLCTAVTKASFIQISGWRMVLRSRPVALAVSQSCFTSRHQSRGLVSRRPLTLFSK